MGDQRPVTRCTGAGDVIVLRRFALSVPHSKYCISELISLCRGYTEYQYIETDLYQSNWCLTKEGNQKVVLKLRNVLLNGKPPT